ncbi:MAG TPA: M6 family metalloprotease domain-containing protein, partial [Firmicutes bacterium]|nr:M6 family metalloprotease domain-containing protein [Bacillota bacterium]
MSSITLRSALLLLLFLLAPAAVLALQPPEPGMLEEMAANGELQQAIERARELGNHELKLPRRGALNLDEYSPQQIADLIAENFGRSLDAKGTSSIGKSTSAELSWVELDLNHDRVVDERDLLALGQPRPKTASILPSMGTDYMFVLLVEFPYDVVPEYQGYFTNTHVDDMAFGAGEPSVWYRGLHYYYDKSSYQQLNIDGDVYGWHTASKNRDYYHPLDNNSYSTDTERRQELIWEAIMAADAAGADFSKYDNDGDGVMDEFAVLWTGPHGAWASFWWGYHTGWSGSGSVVDGVRPGNYSWQWERSYPFGGTPPTPSFWSASVLIHETGHGLGLPDWYDYDGSQGPDGGVGGLDMMHSYGDHSCYNKYLLGWLNPTVAFTNLNDEALDYSNANADAVQFMPGFDPVSPWSEYFMIQNRKKDDIDQPIPSNGLLIWHVDAQVNEAGGMLYNNSYTSHKQLRLMEADGLEEIETGDGQADAGDYYTSGSVLSPTSTPNSNDYGGSSTGITVNDISAVGNTMTADITMFTSNPPTVSITAPSPGATVSGDTTVTINASDDGTVDLVQLLIDGQLVAEWTSGPYSYTWNTLVDFNGSVNVTARAWDNGDQAASDTISVTVSNSGLSGYTDNFETGLDDWRIIDFPRTPRGQFTRWDVRTSPADGTPLGSGQEAYVKPSGDAGDWHNAVDNLRGQRINATGFTYPTQIKFYYRCRSGFKLFATTNEGSSWQELADLGSTSSWVEFNRTFPQQGSNVYLEFRYTGNVRQSTASAHGANIDNFEVLQAPSNPPTVTITSHSDGDTVTG